MSRWDIAEWVGPTGNRTPGGMVESRGLVLHIMEGSYDGSIAWGKNPASSVSFHFATRSDGHIGQLVDTVDAAWTQGSGNGHWISVENEGYSGNPLTDGQVEACARIYAEGVMVYGWPLQNTDSTSGRGLGWHGMGGTAWGGHPDCPGEPIKAQRGLILARAQEILGGDVTAEENWEFGIQGPGKPEGTKEQAQTFLAYANKYAFEAKNAAEAAVAKLDEVLTLLKQGGGGTGGGLSFDQTVEAARQGAELAEDS